VKTGIAKAIASQLGRLKENHDAIAETTMGVQCLDDHLNKVRVGSAW
jgi:hypothetical protein